MELSWSTFALEILNFLVLVWILKRFLYRPVLDVIERRQTGINKTLADAGAMRAEAEKLQEIYEARMADWDLERQQAREALAGELESLRARKMEELQANIEQERLKTRVSEARRQADSRRKIETTALGQGARFAARLLQLAPGPELQERLVEMAIDGLLHLSDERRASLRNSYGKEAETIMLESAYPLPDTQRSRLEQALSNATGIDKPTRHELNGDLLAGIRITISAWVLAANLQDELSGFSALAGDDWHD